MSGPAETTATDLKQRTVTGVLWSAGASVTQQALNFTVTVVLARLLVPADFGLVATIAIFTGFVSLFVDFGLSAALIQRPSLTERHRSSAFWLNLAVGILLAALVAAVAPAIARFFHEPSLVALTLVASINFAIGSMGIVQSALLQRSMEFRRLGAIGICSTVLGGAVAIVMAAAGFGAWSLIGQLVASTAARTLLLWVTSSWHPRPIVDRLAMRELWQYSSGIAGFNAVNYWARNADNLLIGKFVGSAGLGIYSRSYNLMLLPIQQISTVTSRVMFPALSRIQSDPDRVKRAYLRAVAIIALLSFPLLAGLFVVADPFVLALYGAKWADVIPVLQILCIAGLMQPVAATTGWLYQSQGRTDLLFRWGVVFSALLVGAFAIGIQWGAKGVATAYAVSTWLLLYPAFAIPGRLVRMRFREVAAALRGPLLAALAMAAVVWVVGEALPAHWPPAAILLVELATGVAVYGGLVHLFVLGPYVELKGLARERRRRSATARLAT
jgi:O-antigen/teichoic acid export membrane protein